MTLIQGRDPRTDAPFGNPVRETRPDELGDLLAAAAAASDIFSSTGPSERVALLCALADRLDEQADDLVPLAEAETGLPAKRLFGEVARTTSQLRMFATVVEDGGYLQVARDRREDGATICRWLVPLGPVLVFAASNFPFAFSVLGGDTASALAAGCPVIVKAHPSHPGLSDAVDELAVSVVAELGLPAGVFATIHGQDAGIATLRDHRIRAAGFTGSTTVGRLLFEIAASRPDPIPFFGELGSVNPVIATPAAVAARGAVVAREFIASMTLGTGQFCTKPGLLFLPRAHGLDAALLDAVRATEPAPLLNTGIRERFEAGLAMLDRREGVEKFARATLAAPSEGAWASAVLYRTDTAVLREDPSGIATECFGPTAIVVEYGGAADLLAAVDVIQGTLTATVHAVPNDSYPLHELVQRLSRLAGRVVYNGWPTGVTVGWSTTHGGPWPATTAPSSTSVGARSIDRWLRPVSYQSFPEELLPHALTAGNPWHLPQRVDGVYRIPTRPAS